MAQRFLWPLTEPLLTSLLRDLKLWSFGGVVKKDINHEVNLFQGWTYFEVTKPVADTLDYDYKYMSIAKVYYDPINMRAWTERLEDQQPALFKVSVLMTHWTYSFAVTHGKVADKMDSVMR
jgi:hypothetical protein